MSGAKLLETIRIPSDRLHVGASGTLEIEGIESTELVRRFGSPLFVTVEQTIRENYRTFRDAFAAHWSPGIDVYYAIKTNNSLGVRAILNNEGAGGECFGESEYRATLESGLPGDRILLNGSNKSFDEIKQAICNNSIINIDHEDEIDFLMAAVGAEQRMRVNLRLKLCSDNFDAYNPAFFKSSGTISENLRRSKWGFSLDTASKMVRRILECDRLELLGYSCHVGRFTNELSAFSTIATEAAASVTDLYDATGFWPKVIDLGGGWPRIREPESRSSQLNENSIEDYAAIVTEALRRGFEGHELPELWLEPGRYIVGNAVLLLATVGAVRVDLGRTWAHVDASTNHLMRIETSNAWHQVLPASKMNDEVTSVADIVGPTCIPSLIGADRPLPQLVRGDVVAIFDAGMYAEVISNQFNGMGRPANVLISPEGDVELIKRRETYDDVFKVHSVPDRLKVGAEIGRPSTARVAPE